MLKLEILRKKIYSYTEADYQRMITIWRFQGKKIVFTNGCFDILSLGHIDYLSKAKDIGDKLVIGINTDLSVNKLKGKKRPIQDEVSRAMILASLSLCVVVGYLGD